MLQEESQEQGKENYQNVPEEQSERELRRSLEEIKESQKKTYPIEMSTTGTRQVDNPQKNKPQFIPGLSEKILETKPAEEIDRFVRKHPADKVHNPVGGLFDKYHTR